MTPSEIARTWRVEHGYVGRGGVIVLFDGEVQSWVNTLRNADHIGNQVASLLMSKAERGPRLQAIRAMAR